MSPQRADLKFPSPLTLAGIALVALSCLLILQLAYQLGRDRIADNRREAALRILREIIPGQNDNDIFNDTVTILAPDYLGTGQPVTVFRSRLGGDLLGVVYYPVVANGYKGPIELGVGIDRNGRLTGVRVMREDETEGLGSRVHQRESDWILSFKGLDYSVVPREQWDTVEENGYFDRISGATITSRSVINAVRNTLDYHQLAGETLYE